jgi:hypothetical protein
MKRPVILYLLLSLHAFLGVSSLHRGIAFIIKPNGSLLGMQTEWLKKTPFQSFLIPGLILVFILGAFPLITIIGLFLKPKWDLAEKLNIYKNKHWAWAFSLYAGINVIIWITVQQIMTEYFWLQPVMNFTGLLIIICTLTPPIIHYTLIHEKHHQ